jgi:hypothetical protein
MFKLFGGWVCHVLCSVSFSRKKGVKAESSPPNRTTTYLHSTVSNFELKSYSQGIGFTSLITVCKVQCLILQYQGSSELESRLESTQI